MTTMDDLMTRAYVLLILPDGRCEMYRAANRPCTCGGIGAVSVTGTGEQGQLYTRVGNCLCEPRLAVLEPDTVLPKGWTWCSARQGITHLDQLDVLPDVRDPNDAPSGGGS